MELWIRSQNKMALMRCTMFNLDNDQTGIYVYNDDNYMQMAGKYKTKERALEVLDEIQHKLITLSDSMNRHLYVYEMPEE